jgi:predicted phage terminase large subunit-like protein
MNSSISPQAAARELLIRDAAAGSLIAYSQAIEIPGRPVSADADEWVFAPIETGVANHHRLMMRALEHTMLTPMGRLMLFLPPGSAKSTYASVVAPTWIMGKRPGYRAILGSYGDELARKHGRKARQICRSPRFNGIFEASIPSDRGAANEWALTNGSEYMSAGILGGVTGNRADCVIIDDPIKGRQEAESETIRARVKEEFQDSFRTRLLPNGCVIIIQTRWHEDDLAGSILPEDYDGRSGAILCRDGQVWNVLCIPAKAERADDPLHRAPGEYLWPEWFPREHWAQFERDPRTWNALYQQRPAPEDGSFFLREWLKPYPGAIPPRDRLRIYGASDYAVTPDGGDWTVHGVVGMDEDNRMILLDLWREQTDSMVWVEKRCEMVQTWRPIAWAAETGQIKGAVGPWLEKRIRELGPHAYVLQHLFPTKGDKATRARSIQGHMALKGLWYPPGAPWLPALFAELMAFPAGKHDDQVDFLGLIGQLLDKIERGGERVMQDSITDFAPVLDAASRPRLPWEVQDEADGYRDWKPDNW